MSTQSENVAGATNPPIKAASPWVGAVGFAIRMEQLKKGETINIQLENTSSGAGFSNSSDLVAFGPYLPNGGDPFTSEGAGTIQFQMWGSSSGAVTDQDLSFPVYRLDVKPQSIQIVLANNFTTTNSAAYFLTLYVWYQKHVNDLTMKRAGGKVSSSLVGWWVDGNGDYNSTNTNFNDGTGAIEYPISQ